MDAGKAAKDTDKDAKTVFRVLDSDIEQVAWVAPAWAPPLGIQRKE